MIQDAAPAGLQSIDWIIIAFYAAGTIGLGWYYGRRQTSTQEYFVGDRKMSPTLIGVSLFATLLSTITYLSSPGEMIGKGPAMGIAYMVTFPITFLIVGYLVIPIYMRQRVTSAYELLEDKLGIGVRLLAAVMFLVLRLMWMSLLVYTAAAAMTVMLGVGEEAIPLIVLVTAIVSVTYTSLGGLRAVVITDLIQTILLLGGALLVIATVTLRMGGFWLVPEPMAATLGPPAAVQFRPQDPRVSDRASHPRDRVVRLHRGGRPNGDSAVYGDRRRQGGAQVLSDATDRRARRQRKHCGTSVFR